MTVYENIAFGLKIKKQKKKQIKQRVEELLELTGLTEFSSRYPNELSGGQRQRVAFARALAPKPGLLLLDEPFAAIDAKVRQELRNWLREMIYRVGITSIFVTHDQDEAVEVSNQIIVMNQGQIEQIGTPQDIYKNPQTPFVSQFFGQSIFVEEYYRMKGFHKGPYKGAIIRPEFVEAFKADNRVFQDFVGCSEEGIITDILFRGNSLQLKLNVRGIILTANRSLDRRKVKVGDKMRVIIYRVYAFDDEKSYLLENEELLKYDIKNRHLEAYLYSSDGYFVV